MSPVAAELKSSMRLYSHPAAVVHGELKEAGYSLDAPVPPEVMVDLGHLHYLGSAACDNGAAWMQLRARSPADASDTSLPLSRVLDVGAGLGSPARYLAHAYAASVTALEVQPDLAAAGEELTAACGLASRVAHVVGDVLDPAPASDGTYDAAFSLLVFLHIPDKAALFKRLFDSLRPGGRLYVEDFVRRDGTTFTPEEVALLGGDVSCDAAALTTATEYAALLTAAGFVDVRVEDVTTPWAAFVRERAVAYTAALDRHRRVHGPSAAAANRHFYDVMGTLFDGKALGGVRVYASRPTPA